MERNTNTLFILRFIAALIVVCYHFCPPAMYQDLYFLIKNGGEAVNFFFFISGFVMVISNTKNYFNNNDGSFSKSDFYIKRIARIYPLYLFALIAQACFHFGIHSIDTPSVKYRLPFEIIGVQRWFYSGAFNAPDWSVSCEFFFYLMFPFIIVHMRKSMKHFTTFVLVYFVVSVLLTTIFYYLSTQSLPPIARQGIQSLYKNPIFLISTFLFGMLCGKLFIDGQFTFFNNKWNSRFAILFTVPAIFILKYYVNYGILSGGILTPLYFVLIMAITSFKKNETKLFDSTLFIYLGDISFGVYILQAPAFYYYTFFVGKVYNVYTFMYFVFSLIILTTVTYYLIEIPFKRLIINLHNRKALVRKEVTSTL